MTTIQISQTKKSTLAILLALAIGFSAHAASLAGRGDLSGLYLKTTHRDQGNSVQSLVSVKQEQCHGVTPPKRSSTFPLLANSAIAALSIVGTHKVPSGNLFYILPENRMLSLNANGDDGIRLTDLNTDQSAQFEQQLWGPFDILQSPTANSLLISYPNSNLDVLCESTGCREIAFPKAVYDAHSGINFIDADGSLKMFYWAAHGGSTGLYDYNSAAIMPLAPQPAPKAYPYISTQGSFSIFDDNGDTKIINLKTGAVAQDFSASEPSVQLSSDGRFWMRKQGGGLDEIGSTESSFHLDHLNQKLTSALGESNPIWIKSVPVSRVLKSNDVLLLLNTSSGFFAVLVDQSTSDFKIFRFSGGRENFFWSYSFDAQQEKFYTLTGNYVNCWSLTSLKYEGETIAKFPNDFSMRVRDNLIFLKRYDQLNVIEAKFVIPPSVVQTANSLRLLEN